MMDFNQLIPEMKDWNNGAGVEVGPWVGALGNFELAIGYSTIFWPEFVEFERYVLRAGFSMDSLRGGERQPGENRRSIEVVMNHLHIADIHYGRAISQKQVVYLGRVLSEIYRVKLSWQFPSKRFDIFFNDSPTEDLTAYEITFCQVDDMSTALKK